MQFLRGSLRGRSARLQPQDINNGRESGASVASPSAPKPATCRRRLATWALSALGMAAPPTETASVQPGTSPVQTPGMAPAAAVAAASPGRLRVVIVGDVHGSWRPDREEAALRLLDPHLTLLVGDFGNENVELVRQIASLPLPKAVILGNHDAWYTMTGRLGSTARRGAVQQMLSAADLLAAMSRGEGTAVEQDGVRKQLAALGSCHVGYGTMPLDEQGYTVVGARPFSKGGKDFKSIRAFMEGLYGVTSMDESAARIVQVAEATEAHHALIVMGHNGPAGLGSRAFDICGVDWEARAGDHGDPDLQAALAALHRSGRHVALVAFGHMHHHLNGGSRGGGGHRLRRMAALDPATGTVYLNAATVPRVIPAPGPASSSPQSSPPASPRSEALKSFGSGKRARMAAKAAKAVAAAAAAVSAAGPPLAEPTQHHFMVAELEGGDVVSARDVWVQVTPVTDDTAVGVLQAATEAEAAEGLGPGPKSGGSGDGESRGGIVGPRRVGDFVVQVAREHVILRTVVGAEGGVVKFVWNAYDQVYEPYVLCEGAAAVASRTAEGTAGSDGADGVGSGVQDGGAVQAACGVLTGPGDDEGAEVCTVTACDVRQDDVGQEEVVPVAAAGLAAR